MGNGGKQKLVAVVPVSGAHIVGVEFAKKGHGEHLEGIGKGRLSIDDQQVAEIDMRTHLGRYSLAGEGLCIGYDGGDVVSSEYRPKFPFSGGRIVKIVFDVADDAYVDVEREPAAALARDQVVLPVVQGQHGFAGSHAGHRRDRWSGKGSDVTEGTPEFESIGVSPIPVTLRRAS